MSPMVDRLAARADGGNLRRKSVGDGEVFTGGLATRALKALGARAMTVDNAIVMPESFDASKPEDKALFAHEDYHLKHSGGEGANDSRDGEEIAARAAERMVLHTSSGGVESHEAAHTKDNTGAPSSDTAGKQGGSKAASGPNAGRGAGVLAKRGLNRDQILRMLTDQVSRGLDEARQHAEERGGGKKGLL